MFARSEVRVTNKQTPLKTPNALRYATTLGNYGICGSGINKTTHLTENLLNFKCLRRVI